MQAIGKACRTPQRYGIVRSPNIRKVSLQGVPLSIIYREINGEVQVLAVAHHRRRPEYWAQRT
jgi:hypothetical protein